MGADMASREHAKDVVSRATGTVQIACSFLLSSFLSRRKPEHHEVPRRSAVLILGGQAIVLAVIARLDRVIRADSGGFGGADQVRA